MRPGFANTFNAVNQPACSGRATLHIPRLRFGLSVIVVLFASQFFGRAAFSSHATAGGWKRNLQQAGLLHKVGGSHLILAKSHLVSASRPRRDPVQAAADRLKIQIPSNIAPGPLNTVEPLKTSLYLDKLSIQRDLNSTRFDHNHPTLGALLGAEKLLKSVNATDPATIELVEKALLPDTKYYRYFEARRALDPTRFDHYHPCFGSLLAENQRVANLRDAAEILHPPISQAVPEPGTLALLTFGIGVVTLGGVGRRALMRRRNP